MQIINGNNNLVIQGTNNSNITIGGHNSNSRNISEIKALLLQGKIKEALNLFPDTNAIIMLKARFSRLIHDESMGIIAKSDINKERASITHAILELTGSNIVATGSGDIVIGNKIVVGGKVVNSSPLIDPQEIESLISAEYSGYLAEYENVFNLGQRLIEYLAAKCTERDFNLYFQVLKYAVEDLGKIKNMQNTKSVIDAIKEKRDTVLQLLASDAKETTLEVLYNAAANENEPAAFMPKFEEFLNKYLLLKAASNKGEVLENWKEQRDLQLRINGTNETIMIMFGKFKHTWLQLFKNYNH